MIFFIFLAFFLFYKRNRVIAFFKEYYLYFFNKPPLIDDSANPAIVLLKYENKEARRFLATYEFPKDKFNTNIDAIFYRPPAELSALLEDKNNYLEKKWKQKVLFENTPRGLIIMYFDAYKLGFCYYCDQACIPYSLLNAVAMKYVRIFFCRDLFIDDKHIPIKSNAYVSPLIANRGAGRSIPVPIKKSVFINRKKPKTIPFRQVVGNGGQNSVPFLVNLFLYFVFLYRKFILSAIMNLFIKNNESQKNLDEVAPPTPQDNKEYNINLFVFLGKTSNFSCLKSPFVNASSFLTKSLLFNDIFENEHNLQMDVLTKNFTYTDFIRKRKMQNKGEKLGSSLEIS